MIIKQSFNNLLNKFRQEWDVVVVGESIRSGASVASIRATVTRTPLISPAGAPMENFTVFSLYKT